MTILKDKKTAIIFGASGLVGGHCLQALLQQEAYTQVRSFGRKLLPITHQKLKQFILDFDEMAEMDKAIRFFFHSEAKCNRKRCHSRVCLKTMHGNVVDR